MARSSKVDAVEKFRFTVSYDGLTRAGFSEVSIPKYTFNKGEYREGNAPDNLQYFPGLTRTEDITMSRGVTTNQDFYSWIKEIFDPSALPAGLNNAGQGGSVTPIGNAEVYRKDITVTLHHRTGKPVKQWVLHNAFPVAFQPGSDLSATEDGEKAIEQVTIAYESFEELSGSQIQSPETGIDLG